MILNPWVSLWTPFLLSPSPCFGDLRWSRCLEMYVRASCTGVKIKDMVADATTQPWSCAFKSHSLRDLPHPV